MGDHDCGYDPLKEFRNSHILTGFGCLTDRISVRKSKQLLKALRTGVPCEWIALPPRCFYQVGMPEVSEIPPLGDKRAHASAERDNVMAGPNSKLEWYKLNQLESVVKVGSALHDGKEAYARVLRERSGYSVEAYWRNYGTTPDSPRHVYIDGENILSTTLVKSSQEGKKLAEEKLIACCQNDQLPWREGTLEYERHVKARKDREEADRKKQAEREAYIRETYTPEQIEMNAAVNAAIRERNRWEDELYRLRSACVHVLDTGYEMCKEIGEHFDARTIITLHQQCAVCGKKFATVQ